MVKTYMINELNLDLIEPNSETYMTSKSTGSKLCVIGKPGTGKCLHGDTPVLMYNGKVKLAKNIETNDLLMGDDSTKRKVLSVTSGKDIMYRVVQSNGHPYIVNSAHILTLYDSVKHSTYNMEIKTFMSLSPEQRDNLKGYRVSLAFDKKEVPFDPFLYGYYFGMKNMNLNSFELFMSKNKSILTEIYNLRKLLNEGFMETFPFEIENTTRIPECYMFNSDEIRGQFFNGVFSACGWLKRNLNIIYSSHIIEKEYDGIKYKYFVHDAKKLADTERSNYCFSFDNKHALDQFEFIVKSLGGIYVKKDLCLIIVEDPSHKVVTDSNEYTRKCGQQRLYLSDIKVEKVGIDEYYGFTLDGNKRFLLGDTTVTHNTTLISSLLYHKKDIFPCGTVFSGTEDSNHYYSTMFPSSFVFNSLDLNTLGAYIKRQKIAKQYLQNPWSVCLLDDCTDDPTILKKPIFQNIFKNGRHWNMLFILSLQYCMDILPVIRTNIDGTFILRETNKRNRKSLYENYASVFESEKDFNNVLDNINEDYTALYIHNKTQSNQLEDCVFYYKADPIPKDFKFGCEDFWNFHDQRYNPEYVDSII